VVTQTTLETVLRRDRAITGAALAALAALAWVYLLWLGHSMNMDADMMAMAASAAPRPWDAAHFQFMFIMWAVMMVGMMTPSAAPMILLYARVGRQAAQRGRPLAATGFFAAGYLLAWTMFSLGATAAQWALERSLLLSPMMVTTSEVFGGAVLIAAGIYQWTALKDACLTHCRSPLSFIQAHGGFKRDAPGSLRLGLHHGLYCVGCCWALMALLFVVGVMNFFWIAALAVFVLLEKIAPTGRWLPRTAGVLLIAAGIWMAST
jgi:predicted metal-binding membrane protein